jgi:hypothetical protein
LRGLFLANTTKVVDCNGSVVVVYALPGVRIELDGTEVFFQKPDRDKVIPKFQGVITIIRDMNTGRHVVFVASMVLEG